MQIPDLELFWRLPECWPRHFGWRAFVLAMMADLSPAYGMRTLIWAHEVSPSCTSVCLGPLKDSPWTENVVPEWHQELTEFAKDPEAAVQVFSDYHFRPPSYLPDWAHNWLRWVVSPIQCSEPTLISLALACYDTINNMTLCQKALEFL